MRNIILSTDSYKQSHYLQYPPEARIISAYVEARKNPFSPNLLFFGLQAYLIEYLSSPFSQDDIEEAEAICGAHGVPFNREGWQAIFEDHAGFLPVEISALPEGTIVPSGVPLIQIENIDGRFPWLATFIETALLRAIWYPTTVATLSAKAKKIIYAGLQKSCDKPREELPFRLHDFGARGASSGESASLGGLAHMINFQGSDTMEGLIAARRYYDAVDVAGYSIPAAEHSTMTSWGREREKDAYANMIEHFKKGGGTVAVVSDSYDLDNAVNNIWGKSLKDKVLSEDGTLVIRPDSGDPIATPIRTLKHLWEIFDGHLNSKSYRVLNPKVRVIQGDGMNISSIEKLTDAVIEAGFSTENIAMGMGGGLLQKVDRDTMRFAMKANAMCDADGFWHDVSKNPITDPGKGSKAGRQAVIKADGILQSVRLDELDGRQNMLKPIWRCGKMLVRHNLQAIRERSEEMLLS